MSAQEIGPNERRLAYAKAEGIVDATIRLDDESGQYEVLVARHEWQHSYLFRGPSIEDAVAQAIEHIETFPTIDLKSPTKTGPPLVLPVPPTHFSTLGVWKRR